MKNRSYYCFSSVTDIHILKITHFNMFHVEILSRLIANFVNHSNIHLLTGTKFIVVFNLVTIISLNQDIDRLNLHYYFKLFIFYLIFLDTLDSVLPRLVLDLLYENKCKKEILASTKLIQSMKGVVM